MPMHSARGRRTPPSKARASRASSCGRWLPGGRSTNTLRSGWGWRTMPDFPTLADAGGALALGYLLGSIPFGVLFTRLDGIGDVRKVGSGNIGATNVLRTGRRDLAAATLLADALKGTLAVLIGVWIGGWGPLSGALGAFLGHLFPLWIGFR